ncbi:hypothetical protein E2C01_008921 [Portunus trituberculatus]|uniref:Non-haem dioxygenase N-terminal domain-containing protein n=1 Tax=Portunus trituberculatus TaxID=210409 RepID=A0A5B7D569_PORTR|nr:hypothetical protein [Portunus trituberculatus]
MWRDSNLRVDVCPIPHSPPYALRHRRAHHVEEPCQLEWERVTRELEQAFSDIGCAYLTGHGVPDHLINEMLSTSVAFFKQQEEVKIRWAKDTNVHGYMKMNSER